MAKALLVLLVAGCASAPAPVAPPRPTATPLSNWGLPEDCEAWWMEPATHCRGALVHDFDGCRWSCVWPTVEGARQ